MYSYSCMQSRTLTRHIYQMNIIIITPVFNTINPFIWEHKWKHQTKNSVSTIALILYLRRSFVVSYYVSPLRIRVYNVKYIYTIQFTHNTSMHARYKYDQYRYTCKMSLRYFQFAYILFRRWLYYITILESHLWLNVIYYRIYVYLWGRC